MRDISFATTSTSTTVRGLSGGELTSEAMCEAGEEAGAGHGIGRESGRRSSGSRETKWKAERDKRSESEDEGSEPE